VFAYAAYSDGRHTGPADSPDVQAQGSSCRSISLRYALESFSNHSASTTGVALSQATADQQQASGPYGVINSATFSIKSPVWNLTFRNDGGQGEGTYFNGTVSCWSSTGDR
jgi:hypothetical protein